MATSTQPSLRRSNDPGSSPTAPMEWDPLLGPPSTASMLTENSRRRANMILWSCTLLQISVWGFQLSFGSVQQYESNRGDISGGADGVGIVGTTMTGTIYILMPFVSAVLNRYKRFTQALAILGVALTSISLILSAFSTHIWQLLCTLGVLHAAGAALLYISSMGVLNDYFVERKGLAFAITLASKAVTGIGTPFLTEELLKNLGFRNTMLVWAGVVFCFGIPPCIFLRPSPSVPSQVLAPRRVPWSLLKSRTAWIFILATTIFSAGYGLPQTYIAAYASQVLKASPPVSATMLALLAAASAPASILFGMLCDGSLRLRGHRVSVHVTTTLSALTSSLPVFFLWGFGENPALLILFSIIYGFFGGGFSAVWPGVMNEVQRERSSEDQSDAALVFGLLNGGRGIGFVVGGLIGSKLLENGSGLAPIKGHIYGYASKYSSMILFTGITALLGGSNLVYKALWRLW